MMTIKHMESHLPTYAPNEWSGLNSDCDFVNGLYHDQQNSTTYSYKRHETGQSCAYKNTTPCSIKITTEEIGQSSQELRPNTLRWKVENNNGINIPSPTTNAVDNDQTKNATLYKTELCKSFMHYGACRYGEKCQFAHGAHEIRHVSRHPKYKTSRCKSFWTSGQCAYGNRCCFLHDEHIQSMTQTKSESGLTSIPFDQMQERAEISPVNPLAKPANERTCHTLVSNIFHIEKRGTSSQAYALWFGDEPTETNHENDGLRSLSDMFSRPGLLSIHSASKTSPWAMQDDFFSSTLLEDPWKKDALLTDGSREPSWLFMAKSMGLNGSGLLRL